MKLTVSTNNNHGHPQVVARCPHCGREAVMSPLGTHDVAIGGTFICGQRVCPNPVCRGHMFVVLNGGQLIAAYPPVRLDFDPENLPSNVLRTFEEAISCHASGLYIAAAIMVRRTLEEVCAEKQSQGKDLKQRIADLRSKIIIPQELLDAMDELRILGNDAAHIEAKEYDNISDAEVTVAIHFTKEILKSLYQYSALLTKLRALKK